MVLSFMSKSVIVNQHEENILLGSNEEEGKVISLNLLEVMKMWLLEEP
jgi:hypothetical protein